eukprot:GHVR01000234.1.p1 GENE.GHVR01000234.1~~GHVR01000234.1.p1  ORF type:complete len:221 (+),score=24.89 GHVR01000234.1:35-664(+)
MTFIILSMLLYCMTALASTAEYKSCQTACNKLAESCYINEGETFGTLTKQEASNPIIECNGNQGICMIICAAVEYIVPTKVIDKIISFMKNYEGVIKFATRVYITILIIRLLYEFRNKQIISGDTWEDTLLNIYETVPSTLKWSLLKYSVLGILGGGIFGGSMFNMAVFFSILDDIDIKSVFGSIKEWGSYGFDEIQNFMQSLYDHILD